ncbi:MAG: hypothetical protein RL514_3532 [Verrucomicrobiota bacterium]|jgi:dethiobiotin synthase
MKTSDQWSAASGQRRVVVVTGTDTGVGKTVLTACLTRRLRTAGVNAVALKPLCSGGREDAQALLAANDGVLSLDEVNPWHFRAALAPVLAARREGRGVTLAEVVAKVRAVGRRFELVVVEGAGGLLSPLGEGFDTRDLIAALRAEVVIVVPNRLGAVNQARLVWEALPKSPRRRARIVLVTQPEPDAAARSNAALLREFAPGAAVLQLPWVGGLALAKPNRRVGVALKPLVDTLLTR